GRPVRARFGDRGRKEAGGRTGRSWRGGSAEPARLVKRRRDDTIRVPLEMPPSLSLRSLFALAFACLAGAAALPSVCAAAAPKIAATAAASYATREDVRAFIA